MGVGLEFGRVWRSQMSLRKWFDVFELRLIMETFHKIRLSDGFAEQLLRS